MAKKKIESSNENEVSEVAQVATLPPSDPSGDRSDSDSGVPSDGVVADAEHQKAVIDGFYVASIVGGGGAYIVAANSQDEAREIASNALGASNSPWGRGEKLDPKSIRIADYIGSIQSIDSAYFVQDSVLQYGPVYHTEQYRRYMEAFRSKTSE